MIEGGRDFTNNIVLSRRRNPKSNKQEGTLSRVKESFIGDYDVNKCSKRAVEHFK